MTEQHRVRLVGRQEELEVIGDLIDHLAERGAALVVHGEAGIGKSSLLGAARDMAAARGMAVLASTGVQAESELPFAGLHQLLRPLLTGSDQLPPPQRTALRAAFGMTDSTNPDLFLTALAALSLLTDEAEISPLLLLIEDSQWLDTSSCDVLTFIARRIGSDPIVMIAAIRDGYYNPLTNAGLPMLTVKRLDVHASAELLDSRASEFSAADRARFLETSAGNPLALTELPATIEGDLGQRAHDPSHPPITPLLEQAFADRVDDMPLPTQTLLLMAAANDGRDLKETITAAQYVLGKQVTLGLLTPAVSSALLDVRDQELRFRHPLVRSAIYERASIHDRQEAHDALARTLADPDRQVWHRSAATIPPDDTIAEELVAAAGRAKDRGAIAIAVSAMERSADFTAEPPLRGHRLLNAAEYVFQLGRPQQLVNLIRKAESLDLSPFDNARLILAKDTIHPGPPGDPSRTHALVDVADQMRLADKIELAVSLLKAAAQHSWWADPGENARSEVVAAVKRLPLPEDDPRILSILGFADPAGHGAFIIDHVSRLSPDDYEPTTAYLLGVAANVVGAFDLGSGFLSVAVAGLRRQGRLGLLPQVLAEQSWNGINALNWSIALPAAEEATRLARETGQPLWEAAAVISEAMVVGLRGDSDTAEELIRRSEQMVLPLGASAVLCGIQLTRGTIALGVGHHDEAWDHLKRMHDPADPSYHYFMRSWGIGDLAEAALHSGHLDEARHEVERLKPLAETTPAPWFQLGMLYARPLLADEEDAEHLFEAALQTDLSQWPLYRGRLLLEYGTWLRRRRRVADSRAPLRAARDTFDALQVSTWAERARRELRASGETSRQRTPDAWSQLTPQEMQIAQLAAEGSTNKEIGQQLYLSHRTVGSHLYRVFPKLGITARSQLRSALGRIAAG